MVSSSFLRLLGELDFSKDKLQPAGGESRAFPKWQTPSLVENEPIHDEFVQPPEPGSQPSPLRLHWLFRPQVGGVYDVEWIAQEGTDIAPGDPLARLYRVTDGFCDHQIANVPMKVTKHLIPHNEKAISGDALVECEFPSLALPSSVIEDVVDDKVMELMIATNAAFKGYMASIGQSGAIAKKAIPIQTHLDLYGGVNSLIEQVVQVLSEGDLKNGDVVVLSEKLFAVAQGRLFPLDIMNRFDPKTRDRKAREEVLVLVRKHVPDMDDKDLLFADSVSDHPEGPMATAGMRRCNEVAATIAERVKEALDLVVDVVITDTDTGVDVRELLIDTVTVGSTPIGATAGLVLYECMRVANAAEFIRGDDKGIPIVICRPHGRRAKREGMGEYRGYAGRLSGAKEVFTAFA